MQQAVIRHRSGRLAEAEQLYRQVLGDQPNYAHALHLLGLVAFQSGKGEEGLKCIDQAIMLNSKAPDFHLNRGVILDHLGRYQEAIDSFNQSLALKDNLPQTHVNLSNSLRKAGRPDQAAAQCRRALELQADYVEAYLNLGNALQDTGDFDGAIAAFEQVIRLRPEFAEGRHNLGNALARKGQWEQSLAAQRQALRIKPDFAQAARAIGAVLEEQGLLDEAVGAFQQAVAIKPGFSVAFVSLGQALRKKGDWDGAQTSLRQAIMLSPEMPEAHNALGTLLLAMGDCEGAAVAFRQAIVLRQDYADAQCGLGLALATGRDWEAATSAFRQAVVLRPDLAEAYQGLGQVLSNQGLLDPAISAFNRGISLNPTLARTHAGLGVALSTMGDMDGAIQSLRQAAALASDDSTIQNNLGVALQKIGELDQAIACYQRAVELAPNNAVADSNRVYALYFHPDYDAHAILREHRLWNVRHAEPLKPLMMRHEGARDPDRRLRIGYVSPDFREHVVGWELLPLLANHDHERFEIFCYSNVAIPDALTQQLRSHADVWRDTLGLNDQKAAELIRSDQIDILVDLSLHMADNRMLMFARKPAQVQVTYLGYCGTTGLEAMDFRLSDPHLDPLDNDLTCYSEQTIRLATSYWCYQPGGESPDVSPLPSAGGGAITFGCLNNFAKVSAAAMDLWAKVLSAVPHSRLILNCPAGSHRGRVEEEFVSRGIAADRLEFFAMQPWVDYMRAYHRIDIALDPLPYGGGITTCDALWMGVPVVSLNSGTAVGRGGRTIQANVGVPELLAYSSDEYVRIASDLAGDRARLADLRAGLRGRMEKSPLMDAKRFASEVEAAYLQMWRR